ncbi:unnamed protein product [Adineta steineri]|uniref:Uncharacterized protein n=1 Tax=Adineta steineri TaxID=433720 RepID=A0A813Q3E3_9BILA|nr:unnamed protein product [Adineta steineri]CAF3858751.1 unnamed protein product [Adineta steineri]
MSPLADPDSMLAQQLRRFTYEYHVHGHASQWSAPNFVHSLVEDFIDIKCQHDAKKILFDEPFQIPYEIIWLRSSRNTELETYLRSAFDSLVIYDERKMCLDYIASIDRTKLTIYLIVERGDEVFECPNVKAIYRIGSYKNIKRLVLQIRNDVRSDTTSPIRPIERSMRDSFVYRLVNQALRTGDPDLIHPYRFFINELYAELSSIHRQYIDLDEEDFIVYRGQGLTQPELISLQKNVGELVTFASFISTTIDQQMARGYALTAARKNVVSAIFEFHLNTTYENTRPYAYIAPQSAIPNEYEVLISVGTIFQLKSIDHDMDTGLWTIVVCLCEQNNHDIKHLTYTKSRHRTIRCVKFGSSSTVDEPTFHENLRSNLLSTNRNSDFVKTTSLQDVVNNHFERRYSIGLRRRSLPLSMSTGQLTLHEMNWGKDPSDCAFLEAMREEPFSSPNASKSLFQQAPSTRTSMPNLSNLSLFQCSTTKQSSLPNLSRIELSTKQAKCNLMKLKFETNDYKSKQSLTDPLFEATIIDTVVFSMERAFKNFTDSMSLKEEAQLMRRYLKHDFNTNQGRWCDEY